MEIKNKFYIKSIIFATFKTLNTQVSKKHSTFSFLTYASEAQVSISHFKTILTSTLWIMSLLNVKEL